MDIRLRLLDRRELPGFRPYLLPDAVSRLEADSGQLLALGAVIGRSALGAAAAWLEDGAAELTDLFVDSQARGRGVGGILLDGLLERLQNQGVTLVTADYVLRGGELDAMDALLKSRGFAAPAVRSQTFSTRSGLFKGDRFLGAALTPRYRTPKEVVPFSALPPAALAELDGDSSIPDILSWASVKSRAQPELSTAFLREGRVLAYLLAGDSADGGCVLLAAYRREGCPPAAFLPLLREVVHRSYYRFGGDFPCYVSTITPRVTELALRLLGDRYIQYEEHTTFFVLPQAGRDDPQEDLWYGNSNIFVPPPA